MDKEMNFVTLLASAFAILFLLVGGIMYVTYSEEKIPAPPVKFGEVVEVENFFYGKCTATLTECAIRGNCFKCRVPKPLKCQTLTKEGIIELPVNTSYIYIDRYEDGICQEYNDFKVIKRNL